MATENVVCSSLLQHRSSYGGLYSNLLSSLLPFHYLDPKLDANKAQSIFQNKYQLCKLWPLLTVIENAREDTFSPVKAKIPNPQSHISKSVRICPRATRHVFHIYLARFSHYLLSLFVPLFPPTQEHFPASLSSPFYSLGTLERGPHI